MGRVFDFLFPLECIACGAPDTHACDACLARTALSPKVFEDDGIRTASGFSYAQPLVRRLLHDAKYEGWTCALDPLRILVRRAVVKAGAVLPAEGTVAAVPLHPARFRVRGFNQADVLARTVAAASGLAAVDGLLARVRETRSQTEAEDRSANVRSAFACRPLPASLRGRAFVLVDDVRTSGATLRECARALRAAGAGAVSAFTLAWGNGLPNGPEKT